MTLVRNQEQLQDFSLLLDVETGVIGVGSGFGSGILVVILIADVLPGLLTSVERAMSQRSAERQRRWHAEARSEEVETRWKHYFDVAPVGMTILDASGRVVAWSARNEQYLGVSSAQVVGEPVVDILRRLDENHPFIAKVQQVLSGQILTGYLAELATEMGIRTVLVEGDPITDDSGAVTGAFLVGLDVTPLIDKEDGESAGGRRLVLGRQNALASMAGKLVGIRSALLSAGLSAESIAAELSNETPLVDRLRDNAATLTAQQRDAARLADEAFREISDTPDRDVAQLAGPITEAACALFRSRVEKEGIEMDLDDAFSEGAYISAPPVLVRQILINLISNAREAIDRSTKAEERRILIRVTAEADTVDFVVEDTAGSVLPVNRDVYFNPTYSTKDGRAGSGRGLYVSRHTAERLGGQLDVEQGAQGLRFVLTLPRYLEGGD